MAKPGEGWGHRGYKSGQYLHEGVSRFTAAEDKLLPELWEGPSVVLSPQLMFLSTNVTGAALAITPSCPISFPVCAMPVPLI